MRKYYRYFGLLLIAVFLVSCGGGGGGAAIIIPTGNTTLTWPAVTTYEDGSPMNNLAGYKVHYGTSSGHYTNTINVPIPTATTYKVTGLPAGTTYYFVVTAYNTLGVESAASTEVFKKI